MVLTLELEPRPHWWETSALTTVSFLPPFDKKFATTAVCIHVVVYCVYFITISSLLPIFIPYSQKIWPVPLKISFLQRMSVSVKKTPPDP